MTNTTSDIAIRELDHRSSGGIDVRLLWNSISDQVLVAVRDLRTFESFELEVAPGDALLAFRHPYAYANHPRATSSLAA
jgi:hypothetical protein